MAQKGVFLQNRSFHQISKINKNQKRTKFAKFFWILLLLHEYYKTA